MTLWKGNPPLRMTVPLLLDAWRAGGSVENACNTLERMATPPGGREAPPIVLIQGHLPHTGKRWVIDNDGLEWGDALYRHDGNRIRQEVTVHLLEYIPEDRLTTNNAAGVVRDSSDTTVRSYTVKSGDTLSSIAAKLLGDYRRWTEIADLNNLRDPNVIYPGQKILVPKT
jgi:nucleoid-associated protein YgaU